MIQVQDGGLVEEPELMKMKHQWETRVARAKTIAREDRSIVVSISELEKNSPLAPEGLEMLLVEKVEAVYGLG